MDRHPQMEYRLLGNTAEYVSAIGLGGWHLGLSHVDTATSIRLVHAAVDLGVTFMDNSWDYNNGVSESRMGRALMRGYRDRVFLMTKIDGRSRKEATRQLDASLRRLHTDHIDLVQHHEVIRFEDADRIFHDDGAHSALIDARAQGKIRYIGFTGHKDPGPLLRMFELARRAHFQFDTVQMPLNIFDVHYRSFQKLVLPEALKENMGVIAMKSIGDGVFLAVPGIRAIECLRYTLGLPVSVVVTGMDSMPMLEQAVEAVHTYSSMSQEEVQTLLGIAHSAGKNGEFEPYKTSSIFDGTASNPQWLGEEPAIVRASWPNLNRRT